MKILDYDNVDPFDVLELNLLSFQFAFTPKLAGLVRHLDPRPFPFLAIYAVDEGRLMGQAGVFRLPLVMDHGLEDVGGIWAMATHPAYSHRGIGSLLLNEAHARMRAAGLRFSFLGTSRHWVAHQFYHKHEYQEIAGFASAICHQRNLIGIENPFRVEKATPDRLEALDTFFHQTCTNKLGFARRHPQFMSMMVTIGDTFGIDDLRLLWLDNELAGYAVVRPSEALFKVDDILIRDDIDIVEAMAALAGKSKATTVQVTMNNRSPHLEVLRQGGFQVTSSTWDIAMAHSLANEVSIEDLRQFIGIDSNRFQMSWMDLT